jgi:hypothetical protein
MFHAHRSLSKALNRKDASDASFFPDSDVCHGHTTPVDVCQGAAEHTPPSVAIYRALIIMDMSLVQGQDNLTILIPPRSPLLGEANKSPIRGLQFGPSLAVSPPSR